MDQGLNSTQILILAWDLSIDGDEVETESLGQIVKSQPSARTAYSRVAWRAILLHGVEKKWSTRLLIHELADAVWFASGTGRGFVGAGSVRRLFGALASRSGGSADGAASCSWKHKTSLAHVGQMVADRTPNSACTNATVTRLTL